MRVMSFNVGIWTRNRSKQDPFYWKDRANKMQIFFKLIYNPDVICFQELWYPHNTYIPKYFKKVFGTGWEHPIYVLNNYKVRKSWFHIFWSAAHIKSESEKEFIVINMHGHWNNKIFTRICKQIRKFVYKHSYDKIIICGDFNNTPDVIAKQLPFDNAADLINNHVITYKHFYDDNRTGELDYCLVYNIDNVLNFRVYDELIRYCSDHAAVEVEFFI